MIWGDHGRIMKGGKVSSKMGAGKGAAESSDEPVRQNIRGSVGSCVMREESKGDTASRIWQRQ